MRDRQTCIGCGKKSPETETNYTLISAQFGWRLTRYRNGDGTIVIEWRCPTCWRDYKKARESMPGVDAAPKSADPVTPPRSGASSSTPPAPTPRVVPRPSSRPAPAPKTGRR
jgi:hypothetical protein